MYLDVRAFEKNQNCEKFDEKVDLRQSPKRGETLRASLAKQYLEVPHLNYYLLIKEYDYAKLINRAVSEVGHASVYEPKAQTLNTTRRRYTNCELL